MTTTKAPNTEPFPCWPIDSDWTAALKPVLTSPSFQSLRQFVDSEREQHIVYPPSSAVFNAFRYCPLERTKVVILGQDPYHGPNQAHGLSFSVASDCPLPPSLKNIFKELAADLNAPLLTKGDLSDWARQGVLLLNTVLTVRAGQAYSHANHGWEKFSDEVIRQLGQSAERKIVFVLWGKSAAKKVEMISANHTVITSPHPSPLSAYRGFFGSRPFSQVNSALISFGRSPIDWQT